MPAHHRCYRHCCHYHDQGQYRAKLPDLEPLRPPQPDAAGLLHEMMTMQMLQMQMTMQMQMLLISDHWLNAPADWHEVNEQEVEAWAFPPIQWPPPN